MQGIKLYILGFKGLAALKALSNTHFKEVTKVVIGKDSGVENDYSEEIKVFCDSNNLSFSFDKREALLDSEIGIAIGWKWMINCNDNLYVIHDSLLPKYRGFNPLVTALIEGDTEVGVSIIKGSASFDNGDIVIQKKLEITYPIKIETAIQQISILYAEGLAQLINQIKSNSLDAKVQIESDATYSVWRDEADYFIDWNEKSDRIKRQIDAVGYPYLGARFNYEDKVIIVNNAEVIPDLNIINRTPGKVLMKKEGGYVIICGEGLILIKAFTKINGESFEPSKLRMRFS